MKSSVKSSVSSHFILRGLRIIVISNPQTIAIADIVISEIAIAEIAIDEIEIAKIAIDKFLRLLLLELDNAFTVYFIIIINY